MIEVSSGDVKQKKCTFSTYALRMDIRWEGLKPRRGVIGEEVVKGKIGTELIRIQAYPIDNRAQCMLKCQTVSERSTE